MRVRVPTPLVGGSLEDYRAVAGEERVEEVRRLAEPLRGARVLHLRVLSYGTATSELLSTLVPLMNGAGIHTEWQALPGTREQRAAITAVYEALAGNFGSWTLQKHERWLEYSEFYAGLLKREYDFVIVHDPQPATLLSSLLLRGRRRPSERWIWHCHLDLSTAQPEVWDMLRPHLEHYDAVIYSNKDYVRSDLKVGSVAVIEPAIDPLSPRNAPLSADTVKDILSQHSLDPARPLLVQVSRFDRWSDPLGALEIYRLAKAQVPGVQLLLVAMMRDDDFQAQARYEQAARATAHDPDARLLSSLNNVGHTEINAFQRAASVALQTGLRKGHNLHVLEAMWKGRPVVADRVGLGLPQEEVIRLCRATPRECAESVLKLLSQPVQAAAMGKAAHAYVRQQFLITRYLRDYLRLFQCLSVGRPNERAIVPSLAEPEQYTAEP